MFFKIILPNTFCRFCYPNAVRGLFKESSKHGIRNSRVPASHRKDKGQYQLDGPELSHRQTMAGRSRFLGRLVSKGGKSEFQNARHDGVVNC